MHYIRKVCSYKDDVPGREGDLNHCAYVAGNYDKTVGRKGDKKRNTKPTMHVAS
jgi:hypothetical protein